MRLRVDRSKRYKLEVESRTLQQKLRMSLLSLLVDWTRLSRSLILNVFQQKLLKLKSRGKRKIKIRMKYLISMSL